jgi:hypothetical protein
VLAPQLLPIPLPLALGKSPNSLQPFNRANNTFSAGKWNATSTGSNAPIYTGAASNMKVAAGAILSAGVFAAFFL